MHTEQELNKILLDLRNLPAETEWVEFKAARHGYGDRDLGEYFSALSNELESTVFNVYLLKR